MIVDAEIEAAARRLAEVLNGRGSADWKVHATEPYRVSLPRCIGYLAESMPPRPLWTFYIEAAEAARNG